MGELQFLIERNTTSHLNSSRFFITRSLEPGYHHRALGVNCHAAGITLPGLGVIINSSPDESLNQVVRKSLRVWRWRPGSTSTHLPGSNSDKKRNHWPVVPPWPAQLHRRVLGTPSRPNRTVSTVGHQWSEFVPATHVVRVTNCQPQCLRVCWDGQRQVVHCQVVHGALLDVELVLTGRQVCHQKATKAVNIISRPSFESLVNRSADTANLER